MVLPLAPIIGLGLGGALLSQGIATTRDERLRKTARRQAQIQNTINAAKQSEDALLGEDGLVRQFVAAYPDAQSLEDLPPGARQLLEFSVQRDARVRSQLEQMLGVPVPGSNFINRSETVRTRFLAGKQGARAEQREAESVRFERDIGSLGEVVKNFMDGLDEGADAIGLNQNLDIIAEQNPDFAPQIRAIQIALPGSLEEKRRREAEGDIAAGQVQVRALEELGVPSDLAGLVVFGDVSLQLPTSQRPGALTGPEARETRERIGTVRTIGSTLTDVRSSIDEDTVSLFAGIKDKFGGIGRQLPGIKQIMDVIPGLDEETIRKIQVARSDFRLAIARIRALARSENMEGRLSNQELDFIEDAAGLLDASKDAEAAREIVDKMVALAQKLEANDLDILSEGEISMEPQVGRQEAAPEGTGGSRVEKLPDGGFEIIFSDGTRRRLPKVE